MKHLEEFNDLGYPMLLGTSRKSMIGLTLDVPSNERVEGTLVTSVMAVQCGCMFVRVHDVLQNRRAVDMAKAILNVD
jgi:dihydropteroate synthase